MVAIDYRMLKWNRYVALMSGGTILKNKIKVVICDNIEQTRKYFQSIIDTAEDMECVSTCATAKEAIETVADIKPDVVLIDIHLESGEAGIWATEQIKQQFPNIKVIVVTPHEKDDLIFKAYIAGAGDYIIKTSETEEITDSIRTVCYNKLCCVLILHKKYLENCRV